MILRLIHRRKMCEILTKLIVVYCRHRTLDQIKDFHLLGVKPFLIMADCRLEIKNEF